MTPACKNCFYGRPIGAEFDAKCRRYPVTAFKVADDFCGEFRVDFPASDLTAKPAPLDLPDLRGRVQAAGNKAKPTLGITRR